MSYTPLPYSECPAALFHPDDLVPETYPGMRLTTAEALRVEEALAPALPAWLAKRREYIDDWMPYLHPIPVDVAERRRWEQSLRGSASDYHHSLDVERSYHVRVLDAFKKKDWTALLRIFTLPPGASPKLTPEQPSLQPLRDELEQRRLELRREFARRLGCTCLDAPAEAPPEAAEEIQSESAVPPQSTPMDRRSWYMPKESARALATTVENLHFAMRRPKHVVLAELVAVALEHLHEVTARLRTEDDDPTPSPATDETPVPAQQKRVPFGSYIDPELQKELRVACAVDGTEIRDALDQALRMWLNTKPPADA